MDFTAFGSIDATSLRWLRQSETPLQFDLRSGDDLIARLKWSDGSRTLARFQTSEGTWTLKRVGFLNPRVTMRVEESVENAALLTVHLNYHSIAISKDGVYRFHRAGVLVPAWKVTQEPGGEVLHVEPVRDGRKLSAGAVISSAVAVHLPGFQLVVGLSWYFIVLAWFEDEAIASLEDTDLPTSAGPVLP
jgi:hypothetical protein